ncbi:hypothetical protein [Helicobacter ailurogastricus]|uniref:hypothetical protein n=1 Tax=Helicobacter ailurogastricus TaxID=1578720 RepID=UPI000CF17135|nr:hypothetical protein [Helicobacter ailurogastricus]
MSKFAISLSNPSNYHALDHWQVIELEKWQDVLLHAISYDVSVAHFSLDYSTKHQRSGENVLALHPFLFYDVDNDKDSKKQPLSIKGARDLLERYGIAFGIVPSRNYKKLKENDSRPDVERFRIIIPLESPPPIELIKDKELFRKFQEIFAQKLGLIAYVDDAPLRDMARYYARHTTPPLIDSIVVQGRLTRVDKIFQMATQELIQERQEQEARRAEHKPFILPKSSQTTSSSHGHIVIADKDRINAIHIADLINTLEGIVREYKEGTYRMIKTATAKYSITDDNIAYDFKSGKKYGVYAYLAEKFDTPVWNNIARKLGKLMGCEFLVPDPAFGVVLRNAMARAHSRQEVERTLKAHYGVGFVRFEYNYIRVADQCLDYPSAEDRKHYLALPPIT